MNKEKIKLTISADDFGVNVSANRNILKLVKMGKIDRVGVIVNGYYTQKEIGLLLGSGTKIDLHLNSTENNFPRLYEDRRLIRRLFRFLSCFISGKTGAGVMKVEWEKQIEKFKVDFGRFPDGLSSHEHVHFLPAYFKILVILAKENEISFIRFGEKGIVRSFSGVSQILHQLRKKSVNVFLGSQLQSSDYLVSLDWIGDFEKKSQFFPPGEIEVACHPERVRELKMIINLKK